MELLLVMTGIVAFFSILTILELWVLTKMGVDVIGHLRITRETGKNMKFFFEAFGALAFVVAQPIILTSLTIWAFAEARPYLENSLQMLQQAINTIL
ncbi:MAG: hypothetical protein WD002_00755 [Pseudomonadales bacterium]